MDDATEPMNQLADPSSAEPPAHAEEAISVPVGTEVAEEQADHIRQLRERGLPQTFIEGGIKGKAVGFGSGDAAGTIYKNYYGTPLVDPVDGRVPGDELDRLRELYVAPATHTALVDHLVKHGVAVLRGAPGSGRYTTALLAAQEAMDTAVVVLDAQAGVRGWCGRKAVFSRAGAMSSRVTARSGRTSCANRCSYGCVRRHTAALRW